MRGKARIFSGDKPTAGLLIVAVVAGCSGGFGPIPDQPRLKESLCATDDMITRRPDDYGGHTVPCVCDEKPGFSPVREPHSAKGGRRVSGSPCKDVPTYVRDYGWELIFPDEKRQRIVTLVPHRVKDGWWDLAEDAGLIHADEVPDIDYEVMRAEDGVVLNRLVRPEGAEQWPPAGDEYVGRGVYYSAWRPLEDGFPIVEQHCTVRLQRALCKGAEDGQMTCGGLTCPNAEWFDVVHTGSIDLPDTLRDSGRIDVWIAAVLGEMTVYSCDNYLRGLHFAYVTDCTEKTVSVPERLVGLRYRAEDSSKK